VARTRLLERHTNRVRAIALDAWLESRGEPDKAKEIAARRLRADPGGIITTLLIGLAVKLIAELIMHWFVNNVMQPEPAYLASEPGFRGYQ